MTHLVPRNTLYCKSLEVQQVAQLIKATVPTEQLRGLVSQCVLEIRPHGV